MRAGNYGWQAAEAGCIGICFTNTKPNMPAWGGSEPKLGNNPLVIAIPRSSGHIVLDMAMSQFSYGKLKTYLREGKEMPFDAGFDSDGNLTKSPESVIANELALPIGLWKGAGLSLLLDMLATILSGGNPTFQVGESGEESGLSQVFICLDAEKLGIMEWSDQKLDLIIGDLKSSLTFADKEIRYPGENNMKTRQENMQYGVPVDEKIWKSIIKEL
jgi:3-dehydro-L-gulonate 2-dehydrogenase